MVPQDPRVKQIKIKTGVVKRLAREKIMYEEEVKDQESKVEKMKADNSDEYDVRKQIEVLNESRAMIPDCRRRLTTAYNELKQLLEKESELKENEDYQKAQEIMKDIVVES